MDIIRKIYKVEHDIITRERIGARLLELRKELGVTQQRLSEVTGIPRPNIARLERGNDNVGLDIIATVAHALGAHVDIIKDEE